MAEKKSFGDKLTSGIAIASQASGLGLGIMSTLASMGDARKRAEFQQQLESLELEKRNELENNIARASSLNERIKILTNAITQIRIAEVMKKLEKKPESNRQLYFIIGGGVAVLLVAVIIRIGLKK